MRTRWTVLLVVGAVILQVAWPATESHLLLVPNFLLITVLSLSPYLETKHLLWAGFLGAVALDILVGQQFGFYMAFYILLVLLLKLVWRIDRHTLQLTTFSFASLVAGLVYSLLLHADLLRPDYAGQWARLLSQVSLEGLETALVVSVVLSLARLRQRGVISA